GWQNGRPCVVKPVRPPHRVLLAWRLPAVEAVYGDGRPPDPFGNDTVERTWHRRRRGRRDGWRAAQVRRLVRRGCRLAAWGSATVWCRPDAPFPRVPSVQPNHA